MPDDKQIDGNHIPGTDLETKAALETMNKAWYEEKKINDARLGALETKNVSLTKELEDKQDKWDKEILAAETKISELTAKLQTPNMGGDGAETKIKQAHQLLGVQIKSMCGVALNELETKTLSVGNAAGGGYTVPSEIEPGIIKGVVLISPVRQAARVLSLTVGNTKEVLKKTAGFAAAWTTEQGTRDETIGLAFGKETIPVNEMYARVGLTHTLEEDSSEDLAAFVTEEMAEQFGLLEGTAFVSGSGVGQPQGFLTNEAVIGNYTPMGHVTALQPDALITALHALPELYANNATWMMMRTTLGAVRKLKSGAQDYLWKPGLAGEVPNTILGRPYVTAPDMGAVTEDLYPIAIADFRKMYYIIDKVGIRMERISDSVTSARGYFLLHAYRRVGGQVILTEAIKVLKMSVT